MHASEPLAFVSLRGVRITARPAAIDAVAWPSAAVVIRIASDDAFVIDATLDDAAAVLAADAHAIVEDEPMFLGAWLSAAQLDAFVARLEWSLPTDRPALAQGMAAGLAIKLWLSEQASTLLIVSASVAHEIAERFGPSTFAGEQVTA